MIKEFHLPDGSPVSVNLSAIAFVQPVDAGTLITFIGGTTFTVVEPYDEVSDTKKPERTVGFGVGA